MRLVLVATVALIAGGTAAGAVLATHGAGGSGGAGRARPIPGRPPLILQLPGPAVTGGNTAVYAAARRRLPPGDVRLDVGRVVTAYDPAHRDRTVAALEKLPQTNPAVVYALGLAQLWAGQSTAAQASLERVKALDPYGFYGTAADNLLHLNQEVNGYPFYVPATPAARPLAALQAAVRANPRSAPAWLALAAKLQRTDRLAAVRDARRAASLNPTGVSEQVALAVLAFNKDRPMDTMQTLQNLASNSATQHDPEVLFHLGLLDFWLEDAQDAAGEFRQVQADAPHSRYAVWAHVFERCIDSTAACRRLQTHD